MRARHRRLLISLFFPCGALLFAAAALIYFGYLPPGNRAARDLYAGLGLAAGALFGFRFRSSRMLIAAVVFFVAQQVLSRPAAPETVSALWVVLAVVVPLNLLALAVWPERGITMESLAFGAWFVLGQIAAVALLVIVDTASVVALLRSQPLNHQWFAWTPLPQLGILAYGCALFFCVFQFVTDRDPLDLGLLWASIASFIGLHSASLGTGSLYLTTAGIVIAASFVEKSHALAYVDELTGLPGRRAFNELLDKLQDEYAIAILDVDHFKRFNDTFGHETGDQVLRMVAARIADVGGGGKAFRCGGEEFAVVFPHDVAVDVLAHLEDLRENIATTQFAVRGLIRRRSQRPGGDRRRVHANVTARTGGGRLVHVTVSIGVASPTSAYSDPTDVVQAADRALYEAKGNGRNRVELAARPRIRASKPEPVQAR